jgi:hypothetical protein
MVLAAGLIAVNPWIALFPRDSGRRWTEVSLRTLLVVYPRLLIMIPSLFALFVGIVVRARRLAFMQVVFPEKADSSMVWN